jgi:hypothetical protein
MTEKSILEQALLQVQTLEEAVKANAKGILASTMKQELNELLKESLEEEEEDKETPEEEETDDVTDTDDETSEEGDDTDDLNNDESSKGIDSLDSGDETSTEDEPSMGGLSMGGDTPEEGSEEDNVLDMSGAPHDEVMKVFKSMKPEDGIVVKKDGNNIELATGDDDYIIKLDEEETDESLEEDDYSWSSSDSEMSEEEEISGEENEPSDEETVYEIELDVEDPESSEEGEFKESARTIGNGYHAGIASKKKFYAGNKRDEINEEVKTLKKQNAEYKKALILFKDKLNEVAVFNANLAYATRLFTEHSTTKQEKLNILKRFDSVSTMNESKNLFNTIKSDLDTKKPVTESVANKITSTPTSSSTEILSESKAYENPQFKRMKDLMGKIK